jgi:hypothetical protein
MCAEDANRIQTEADRDFEIYKILLEKWAAENPIKTNKLQVLLAVNALLVSALGATGGLTADKWYVYLAGAVFSLVWTLSIGRTSLFQALWKIKLDRLRKAHPTDPRFAILDMTDVKKDARKTLRFLGGVSSKWYLMFSPLVFAIAWLVVLVYATGL